MYVPAFRKLYKVACSKGCIHNQGGLKIRRLLCEYSRGISFLQLKMVALQ